MIELRRETMKKEDNIIFEDWGVLGYRQAWERQQLLFSELIDRKLAGRPQAGRWILCEHRPVITLGRHGKRANLLFSPEFLSERGIDYVETDRGGDITYHGPGQLVCYPILDLERLQIGLKEYVDRLEQLVIRVLARYGITAGRVPGATGVWLDAQGAATRKICAIGVKSSRYVTMHGFALNVNTDLTHFSYIHPCGFIDRGVTSLERELGASQEMSAVKQAVAEEALFLFG